MWLDLTPIAGTRPADLYVPPPQQSAPLERGQLIEVIADLLRASPWSTAKQLEDALPHIHRNSIHHAVNAGLERQRFQRQTCPALRRYVYAEAGEPWIG